MDVNIQEELAQLLGFVADVAAAIRLHSAYNRGDDRYSEYAAVDVMWLSEALHQFGSLAHALLARDTWRAQLTAEMLSEIYDGYRRGSQGFTCDPKDTFDRHAQLVKLDVALAALDAISSKLQGQVAPSVPPFSADMAQSHAL
jgi:hypothetical protein